MAERDYQVWGIDALWTYFEKHTGNPVCAMPTGTGKSHMISGFALKALRAWPTTRIMVLTHVKELIAQNYSKFIEAWPTAPAGIFSAGLNKKEFHLPVTFGGIQSVAKKAALFGHIDIIFVDECDLVNPTEKTMYSMFISQLKTKNPHVKVIGLTATPWRAGLGAITNEGGLFTDVPVDMTGVDAFNWFIEEGYLVPLIPKPTVTELDTSGVHMRGGDFIEKELQQAVDVPEITRKALHEAREIGHDRNCWLIFASGVQHAKHIVEQLDAMGISAHAVYSGMNKDGLDRDKIIQDFKDGKFTALVNNNILTTGFDCPRVDMIIMLRPTGSSRLWVQMLGRGTRPWFVDVWDPVKNPDGKYNLDLKEHRLMSIAESPKQNTLVLDFGGNIRKLGPINDPVIPKQKGKGPPGEAPVKLCPHCNTWCHATVRFCGGKKKDDPKFDPARGCGYEFAFETKLKVEASTTSLIKGKIDLPIVEVFKVDHITYTLHTKVGAEPMIRVTYYCGLKNFTDYVCLQHPEGNYARKRARDWWRERSHSGAPIPTTTDDGLDQAPTLAVPTHLSVWVNQKHPVIQKYCYDGSAFGKADAADAIGSAPPPTTVTHERAKPQPLPANLTEMHIGTKKIPTTTSEWDDLDDDIPF